MQQVYLKRLTKQDITKSVTICTESVQSFWGIDPSATDQYIPISIYYAKRPDIIPEGITIHKGYQGEKDWRICGDGWKKLYADDNADVEDIMVIKKYNNGTFSVAISKRGSTEYDQLISFFNGKDNYALISADETKGESDGYPLYNVSSETTEKYGSFMTAIRSKPFLLLAGISGTGKSRIVREFAYMTCPERLQDADGTSPGNYCIIEVKPNWHDSTELLGYYSSFANEGKGGYRFTKFDKFVVKAWLNPDVPFFLCLDEMNLAPVEQYFAEFLSVLETRSRDKDNNIVTGTIIEAKYFSDNYKVVEEIGLDKAEGDWGYKVRNHIVTSGLTLPPNLIVIGTVNMDDTTYQFSRKVIDRAMTIEMNGGELSQMFGNSKSLKYRSDSDIVEFALFKAPYINADEVIEHYQGYSATIIRELPTKLSNINAALKDTPFLVSYRVLNELVVYLGNLMDEATARGETIDGDVLQSLIDLALDKTTLMKILPRIEGDEDMFRRSGGANVLKVLQSLFAEESESYKKLTEMIDRLDRTGFTRFWP